METGQLHWWSRGSIRLAHLDELRKNSLWVVPSLCVVTALVLSTITIEIDYRLALDDQDSASSLFTRNIDDARQVVATIATAMLAFVGVVFSITLVALQLASTQYSPRVVRSFVRSPLTKWTLGIFLATFTYSFATLASFESEAVNTEGGEFVPATSVGLAFAFVIASLFVFIAFVHGIVRSMRVTYVIRTLADETRGAIELNYPLDAGPAPALPDLGPPTASVALSGHPGVIAGMDAARLVRIACHHGTVLRVTLAVGAYAAHESDLVEVHGGTPPTKGEVRSCFDLGVERTLYQDPGYGLRQLVDIAIRALSPAVNDPTTAVQVIDRVEEILSRLVSRPMPSGVHVDADGHVRLVHPVFGWDALVDLAFTEICHYGADAPQVTRRLSAAFDALGAKAPADRRTAIEMQRLNMQAQAARMVIDQGPLAAALVPDRIGLG
jgi:uncharacterized membrane protein